MLGITQIDLSVENEIGAKILNRHASIGLVYLCGTCQTKILPQKDNLKIKSIANKSFNRGPTTIDDWTIDVQPTETVEDISDQQQLKVQQPKLKAQSSVPPL